MRSTMRFLSIGVILFLKLYLASSVFAKDAEGDQQWSRLVENVGKILAIRSDEPNPTIARLNEVLVEIVKETYDSLSPRKQAAFAQALESAKVRGGDFRPGAAIIPFKYPTLSIPEAVARTPLGRINFIHELTHIVEYLGNGFPFEPLVWAGIFMHVPMYTLRSETRAFQSEYAFLIRAFGASDHASVIEAAAPKYPTLQSAIKLTRESASNALFHHFFKEKIELTRLKEALYVEVALRPYKRINQARTCLSAVLLLAECYGIGASLGMW